MAIRTHTFYYEMLLLPESLNLSRTFVIWDWHILFYIFYIWWVLLCVLYLDATFIQKKLSSITIQKYISSSAVFIPFTLKVLIFKVPLPSSSNYKCLIINNIFPIFHLLCIIATFSHHSHFEFVFLFSCFWFTWTYQLRSTNHFLRIFIEVFLTC